MSTLPNARAAVVPIEKLRDYAINPQSEEGAPKARVFAAALGLRKHDAEWLQKAVLENVARFPCHPGPITEHGKKYVVDISVSHGNFVASVRTAWIIHHGKEAPRLVSLYVLEAVRKVGSVMAKEILSFGARRRRGSWALRPCSAPRTPPRDKSSWSPGRWGNFSWPQGAPRQPGRWARHKRGAPCGQLKLPPP